MANPWDVPAKGGASSPWEVQPKGMGVGGAVLGGLGILGKVLDAAGGVLTRPFAGAALGALKGKHVLDMGDVAQGLNPTNLKTAPNMDEYAKRAGIPPGAKLSDVVGGYAEPGQGEHWYSREKGGLLDPTLRGTGGFAADMALDPLNYASLGFSGLVKKAAAETLARSVGKEAATGLGSRVLSKVGSVAQKPVDWLTAPSEAAMSKLGDGTVSKVIQGVAQAPSTLIGRAGKAIYNSGLIPIEHAGEKFGKADVGDTLYKHGIWGTAPSIAEQSERVGEKLKGQADTILAKADAAGGTMNREEAFQKLFDEVQANVKDRRMSPEDGNALLEKFSGRFAPGKDPSLSLANQWKSDVGKEIPKSPFSASPYIVNKVHPMETDIGKSTYSGMRQAIENGADRALSTGVGTGELHGINDELGKILSTKNAMTQMANKSENKSFLNMGDFIAMSGGGAVHGGMGVGEGLLLKKIYDAQKSTLGRTGLGYGVRKAAEGELTGPALDALIRREYINKTRKDEL